MPLWHRARVSTRFSEPPKAFAACYSVAANGSRLRLCRNGRGALLVFSGRRAEYEIEIGAQHAPDVEWREFVEERGPQKRHRQRCSALKPKALTTDIMDSDSINLGSNPGPPANFGLGDKSSASFLRAWRSSRPFSKTRLRTDIVSPLY